MCNGQYAEVTISSSTSNSVTVDISSCPTANRLFYNWRENPCEYKQCSIYSDDEYSLPAPVWFWDI